MEDQTDGHVARLGLLPLQVEDSCRVYLHMGPSESIKDHEPSGQSSIWL